MLVIWVLTPLLDSSLLADLRERKRGRSEGGRDEGWREGGRWMEGEEGREMDGGRGSEGEVREGETER